MPARRGEQEQLARRHAVRDLLGDAVAEVARQVLDGLGAQLLEAVHVVGDGGIELVDAQEAIDLGDVGEREPVPVDDRAAAQKQAHRLDVAERRLFEAGRVGTRHRAASPLARRDCAATCRRQPSSSSPLFRPWGVGEQCNSGLIRRGRRAARFALGKGQRRFSHPQRCGIGLVDLNDRSGFPNSFVRAGQARKARVGAEWRREPNSFVRAGQARKARVGAEWRREQDSRTASCEPDKRAKRASARSRAVSRGRTPSALPTEGGGTPPGIEAKSASIREHFVFPNRR